MHVSLRALVNGGVQLSQPVASLAETCQAENISAALSSDSFLLQVYRNDHITDLCMCLAAPSSDLASRLS